MSEEKKQYTGRMLLLATLIGVLMGLLLSPKQSRQQGFISSTPSLQGELEEVTRLIEEEYVDPVDRDSITELALRSMLSSLDPHSLYLNAQEFQQQNEEMHGSFEGIGITLRYWKDTVFVMNIIAGGPASHTDLRPGDRIITVDTAKVSGVGMEPGDVVKLIRGPRRTTVDLGIERYGTKGLLHIVSPRGVIGTPSIICSNMLDAHTGYIRLIRFSESSHQELCYALQQLQRQGMKQLVLDLRQNGGGLLTAAIEIADEFLSQDNLIVYTEGHHQRRQNVYATKGGLFEQGRLAILIDEFSASASEVLSGAIQDNDRGLILGRRSFGKGLVQRQFPLSGNSAVLLTIARYYTPSGRCIQRPYDKGSDEYYTEFLRELLVSREQDTLVTKITDTTRFYTQSGKVVYGGGGIYPDKILHFSYDTNLTYCNELMYCRAIEKAATDYVARNYPQLHKSYANEQQFIQQFKVDKTLHQQTILNGERLEVPRNTNGERYCAHRIDILLKAYIAEMLFSQESYYKVCAEIDTELQEARKYIK